MRTVSQFFFFFRVVRLGARGFSDQASHQRQQLGPGKGGAKMRGTRVLLCFTGIKKHCIFQDLYFFLLSLLHISPGGRPENACNRKFITERPNECI